MAETLRSNINTANVSDDAHQTLLVDETNIQSNLHDAEKLHINKPQDFNNDDLEKNIKKDNQPSAKSNQKSNIYFYDRLIMILVIILGLLFLLVIALTIVSLLYCYSTANHPQKSTRQYNKETTDLRVTTVTNGHTTPANDQLSSQRQMTDFPLPHPMGRAKYVDKKVLDDYEN